MHVDRSALLNCIRETLDTFLGDHLGLEHAEVSVAPNDATAFDVTVDGVRFTLGIAGGLD